MSKLYYEFQIPASNTAGGAAETMTVLQSGVVNVLTSDKGITVYRSPLCGRGGGGWGS